MKLVFVEPFLAGDAIAPIRVAAMELISVSFNLACEHGKMNVAITLRDLASGYQEHVVCEDADKTPQLWGDISRLVLAGKPWPQCLLERLVLDGKVRSATISSD